MKGEEHYCELDSPEAAYGAAITSCYEEAGAYWAGNGEYYSQVNYCPVCGAKAPVQVGGKQDSEGLKK